MDKKAILAVTLSLMIWIGWQKFYLEPIQKQAAVAQEEAAQAAATAAQEKEKTTKREETKAQLDAGGFFPDSIKKKKLEPTKGAAAPKEFVLENKDTKLVVSNEFKLIRKWELKNISNSLDDKTDTVNMEHVTGVNSQLELRFSDPEINGQQALPWSEAKQVSENSVRMDLDKPLIKASKLISLDSSGYGATVEYKINFSGSKIPAYVFLGFFGSPKRAHDKEGSVFGATPDIVDFSYRSATKRHTNFAKKIVEKSTPEFESAIDTKWIGVGTKYFVLAATPLSQELRGTTGIQISKQIMDGLAYAGGTLAFATEGKKELTIPLKIYFGPKNWESLKMADPIFTDAIDYGWTSFLAVPLLQGLKWLYSYVHNYGLAIIILTFLIKMLLFPLTYKSTKAMSKMAKLQPQLNALREKYKDNKEKLNQEMMSFMKTNGYNPVGGCLPILFQMPIFFSLYRVLFNSMELYQAPFIGWIHDLSSPDPFFITPVLLAGLMFFQQKLTPNTSTDPAQQKMLQIMPVMFGVFMLLLPAGLNIYMVVNSATSIAQQWVLNRKLGITPARAKA